MDLGYLILDIGILEGRINLECFRILLYIIVFSTFLLWIKKSFFFFSNSSIFIIYLIKAERGD